MSIAKQNQTFKSIADIVPKNNIINEHQLQSLHSNKSWVLIILRQADPTLKRSGAICVQKLDDSRVAGRINFRTSLRSSSTREPSDPLLAVV